MVRPQPTIYTIRTAAEWDAINSPVRLEMVVFLIVAGTCAIRELAALIDRPADGLYHHLRKLVRAGLVEEVGTRPVGKRTEKLYRTVARDIAVDRDLMTKRTRDRTVRLFRTILQHAQRTIVAAIESGAVVFDGPRANLKFNWLAAWLDDAQMAEIVRHQEAIRQILMDGLQHRHGQLVAVLTYMAPIQRTRGSKPLTD